MDYIRRAVAYKQEGHSFKELKEAFNISSATYYDWREKPAGGYYDVQPKRRERRRKIDKEALKQAVSDKPDAFLREPARRFDCTAPAIFYALEKYDITGKKIIYLLRKTRSKAYRIYRETEACSCRTTGLCR